MTQSLLTIPLGRAMQCFIEQQQSGNRVVSIAPHYNDRAMLMGYLVVIERPDPPDASHKEPRERTEP